MNTNEEEEGYIKKLIHCIAQQSSASGTIVDLIEEIRAVEKECSGTIWTRATERQPSGCTIGGTTTSENMSSPHSTGSCRSPAKPNGAQNGAETFDQHEKLKSCIGGQKPINPRSPEGEDTPACRRRRDFEA